MSVQLNNSRYKCADKRSVHMYILRYTYYIVPIVYKRKNNNLRINNCALTRYIIMLCVCIITSLANGKHIIIRNVSRLIVRAYGGKKNV